MYGSPAKLDKCLYDERAVHWITQTDLGGELSVRSALGQTSQTSKKMGKFRYHLNTVLPRDYMNISAILHLKTGYVCNTCRK